jgi:hypothetical protein
LYGDRRLSKGCKVNARSKSPIAGASHTSPSTGFGVISLYFIGGQSRALAVNTVIKTATERSLVLSTCLIPPYGLSSDRDESRGGLQKTYQQTSHYGQQRRAKRLPRLGAPRGRAARAGHDVAACVDAVARTTVGPSLGYHPPARRDLPFSLIRSVCHTCPPPCLFDTRDSKVVKLT